MNWISKELLLATCISLLIALVSISWLRPSIEGPKPKATESTNGTNKSNHNSSGFDYWGIRSYINVTANYCTSNRPNAPSEWRKNFICDSKITDVVIAILTLFLMIFTGLLVWVGNKQEKTTRRQLRAFIYLHSGSIYNVAYPLNPLPIYKPTGAEIMSPGEGPVANLIVRNSGSTPAFKVVHYTGIHVAEYPLKSELPAIQKIKNPPNSAIAPEGINTKRVNHWKPLTSAQIAGLRDGTVAIWVYGEIIYRDAFRRKRRSRYRLFHSAPTGTIGITTDLTWAEEGNDAN